MATVIGKQLEHAPHHHLGRAIRGHDEIVAAIAEHAEEEHRKLEAIREERSSAAIHGSAAGPGSY